MSAGMSKACGDPNYGRAKTPSMRKLVRSEKATQEG
jgi:hypothetical protein